MEFRIWNMRFVYQYYAVINLKIRTSFASSERLFSIAHLPVLKSLITFGSFSEFQFQGLRGRFMVDEK